MAAARALILASALALPACGGEGAATKPETTAPAANADASAPSSGEAVEPAPVEPVRDTQFKVLVTGFNDWKELGEPPNVWRCRDNPSCRLLLGDARDDKPTDVSGGPLVAKLQRTAAIADGRAIAWTFDTMPVTWGAAEELSLHDYDLVLHLGLGVYDNFDHILVESGAYNRRQGKDAAGSQLNEAIEAGGAERRAAPEHIAAKLAPLNGQQFAGYTLDVAEARPTNDYLCNETHYRALQSLDASKAAGARLERVHFVHIPYAKDGDYAALAEGVGGVVLALLP